MNFEKISDALNNKEVVVVLQGKSFYKFGRTFAGRLVGRCKKGKGLTVSIISFTILAKNYITYEIPVEDIKNISKIFF